MGLSAEKSKTKQCKQNERNITFHPGEVKNDHSTEFLLEEFFKDLIHQPLLKRRERSDGEGPRKS